MNNSQQNRLESGRGGQMYIPNTRKYIVEKVASVMESLLFAYGDPISLQDIRAIFLKTEVVLSQDELMESIAILKKKYEEVTGGLELIEIADGYQLGTKKENYEYLSCFLNPIKKKSLTQASLETLSIIAYKQPTTKSEIENIRGVKSDRAIATLMDAGLIQENGRLDKIGRPIIYGTTEEFLRHFSLNSLKDLPETSVFEENNDEIMIKGEGQTK